MTTQTTTTVLGYGRVSTDKQELSPEAQTKICRDWYDREVAGGVWKSGSKWGGMIMDLAVSSKVDLFKRPKGQLIPTLLQPGDVMVAAKIWRAFRSAADAELSLEQFKEMQIRCVLIDMQVDTSTYNGLVPGQPAGIIISRACQVMMMMPRFWAKRPSRI